MNSWTWNPKVKGSGMIECIPQTGLCPNSCKECFFQGGRSYLEPLSENLPHIPSSEMARGRVVRMNDGNDSNNQRDLVIETAKRYQDAFFNTSLPDLSFPGPVVLTVNPGEMTDHGFHAVSPCPPNLMFVRARTNAWNLSLVERVIDHYAAQDVPVVLTFMAYFDLDAVSLSSRLNYVWRKRTQNSYWAITTRAWREIMRAQEDRVLVYSCGKIEGERGTTACARCGNCLREYYAAKERLRVPRSLDKLVDENNA